MAKKLLPFIIIIASVLVAGGLYRFRSEPEQSVVVQQTILVDVMAVIQEDSYITVASQGTVEPRTRTNLISEVSGQVIEVSPAFVAGGFFRTGDVLLQLDKQNYRAAVSRNQAAVAAARSQLAQERGQGDVAQREWERMTPERQTQIRAKDLYLRKPQLEEALARLASADADLEQSLNDLRKTTIISPYDGLISAKNTDIGQFVSTGSSIAEMFAVDYAEVRLPIPETKIQFLDLPALIRNSPGDIDSSDNSNSLGPEVELVSRVGNREYSWIGHLVRTEGVLDTRTRVLFSVVQVKDPYGLYNDNESNTEPLRIGTFVNANIQGKLLKDVVILPRYTLQANNLVWVADPENRLRSRKVEVITINGDNVYISAGLKQGDRVVITRLENPLNGTPVQTNKPSYQAIR